MRKFRQKSEWDEVIAICAAFTGKWMQNPFEEVKVLPWSGWNAYFGKEKEDG